MLTSSLRLAPHNVLHSLVHYWGNPEPAPHIKNGTTVRMYVYYYVWYVHYANCIYGISDGYGCEIFLILPTSL